MSTSKHPARRLAVAVVMFAGLLVGCATTYQPVDTTNLAGLENLTQQELQAAKPTISKIRFQALQETAMGLGAQGGLAWRAAQIDAMLESKSHDLNRAFNFNGLLLDHNIVPPVLQESHESLQLDSPEVIRAANRTYKLVKQAHFVTTPPTWRDYLWMDFKKPDLPDSTLLPQTSEERKLWKTDIQLGWRSGIKQANAIYANRLAKLHSDFNGMLLYRKLLAHHMVSKPFVAKTNMGITSNADETEMRIDDRILRITAKPKLNLHSKKWKPILVPQQ